MEDQSDVGALAWITEEGSDEGIWLIVRTAPQLQTYPPTSVPHPLAMIEGSLDGDQIGWKTAYVGDEPWEGPTNVVPLIPLGVAAVIYIAHHGGAEVASKLATDIGFKIFGEKRKKKKSERERDELHKAASCAREHIAKLWKIDAADTGLTSTAFDTEQGSAGFLLRYGDDFAEVIVNQQGETYAVIHERHGKLKRDVSSDRH